MIRWNHEHVKWIFGNFIKNFSVFAFVAFLDFDLRLEHFRIRILNSHSLSVCNKSFERKQSKAKEGKAIRCRSKHNYHQCYGNIDGSSHSNASNHHRTLWIRNELLLRLLHVKHSDYCEWIDKTLNCWTHTNINFVYSNNESYKIFSIWVM